MRSSRPFLSYHHHLFRDNGVRQPPREVYETAEAHPVRKLPPCFPPYCHADVSGHRVIEGKKLWVAPIVYKQFLCDKRNPPLEMRQVGAHAALG
jgi:hypothetical protein